MTTDPGRRGVEPFRSRQTVPAAVRRSVRRREARHLGGEGSAKRVFAVAIRNAVWIDGFIRAATRVEGKVVGLHPGGSHPQISFVSGQDKPVCFPPGGLIFGFHPGDQHRGPERRRSDGAGRVSRCREPGCSTRVRAMV
jgi:hypothetical protein